MSDLDACIELTRAAINTHRGDEKQTALSVRSVISRAITQEPFLLACADAVLSSIERRGKSWRNPPLYAEKDGSITLRLIYWPPGFKNSAHLHRSWTVTGVVHNEIVVETFRQPDLAGEIKLGPSESFVAHAGNTGFLLPPCVHRLYNPSRTDSATLHVFSADDPNVPVAQTTTWIADETPSGNIMVGVHRRALCVMSEVLARIKAQPAVEMLTRIFAAGDPTAKLHAVKALAAHDVKLAYQKSRELEASIMGHEREALARINKGLEAVLAA